MALESTLWAFTQPEYTEWYIQLVRNVLDLSMSRIETRSTRAGVDAYIRNGLHLLNDTCIATSITRRTTTELPR